MSTMTSTETLWVILDAANRIVLICGGADAPGVAHEWGQRGYCVQTLGAREVRAV